MGKDEPVAEKQLSLTRSVKQVSGSREADSYRFSGIEFSPGRWLVSE